MNLPLLPPCPRCFLFASPTPCSVYARGTLTCKDPTRALWPLLLPAEFSHQRRVVRVHTVRGVKESYLIPPNPGWEGRGHISHSIVLASRLLALPPGVIVAVLSDSPRPLSSPLFLVVSLHLAPPLKTVPVFKALHDSHVYLCPVRIFVYTLHSQFAGERLELASLLFCSHSVIDKPPLRKQACSVNRKALPFLFLCLQEVISFFRVSFLIQVISPRRGWPFMNPFLRIK